MTLQDVALREAVESLGADRHRFVLCELKDGRSRVGGILNIERDGLYLSQGITGQKKIYYWDRKDVPQPIVAPGEHLANGLKWTGVVAGCVAISPMVIALLPLILTGVISE